MAGEFSWDDYPAAPAPGPASAFNWEEHPEVEPSTGQAFGTGVEQGATLGFRPRLAGLGGQIGSYLAKKTSGLDEAGQKAFEDQDDSFEHYKKEAQAQQEAAQKAHPIATGAGLIAGGLVPTMLGAKTFLPGNVPIAGSLAEGATEGLGSVPALSKTAQLGANVALGAGEGALAGVGNSQADLTGPNQNLPLAAKDAAAGAVIGGAVPLAGAAIGAGLGAGYRGIKGGLNSLTENSNLVQQGKRAVELGRQGLDIAGPAAEQRVSQQALEAAQSVAEPIAQKATQAESKIAQVQKDAVDALQEQNAKQVDAVNEAADKLAELQKSKAAEAEAESANAIKEAGTRVNKDAYELSDFIENGRKQSGKTIDSVYNQLGNQNVKIDVSAPLKSITDDLAPFVRINNVGGQQTIANPEVSGLIDQLNSYNGQIDPSKLRELKDVFKANAFGNSTLPPVVKSILRNGYADLNTGVASDLTAQEASNPAIAGLSDQLTASNKSYSSYMKMQDTLDTMKPGYATPGTPVAPNDTVNFVKNIAKNQADPSIARNVPGIFEELQKVAPDKAQSILDSATEASKQYQTANQPIDMKTIVAQKIQEAAQNDPDIANIVQTAGQEVPKLTNDVMNATKSAAVQQNASADDAALSAINDFQSKVGSQRLPSGETSPSQGLSSVVQDYSTKMSGDLLEKKNLLDKALATATDPEQADAIKQQLTQVSKDYQLVKSANTEGINSFFGSAKGVGLTTLNKAGNIGQKAVNAVRDLADGAKNFNNILSDGDNLAQQLSNSSPEQLQGVAKVLKNTPGMERYVPTLDQAINSTNPVSRNAALFMLHQNTDFRKMFENQGEQK